LRLGQFAFQNLAPFRRDVVRFFAGDFAELQQVFEITAIILDGADFDTGAGATIARQEVGQYIAGNQRGDADIQRTAGRILLAGKTGAGIGNGREDLCGMAQELMAVMGNGQPARMAVEKLDAEVALKFLQGFGDRGLRNRQILRGAGERKLLRHGNEHAQAGQRQPAKRGSGFRFGSAERSE